MKLSSLLDEVLTAAVRWLAGELSQYLPPRRPSRFSFRVREVITPMGKVFEVSVQLPEVPTPNDIATQELVVTVNGEARPAVDVDLGETSVVVGAFAEGTTVEASLVYVDDSVNANRSPARVESLTVSDTEAPPEPGVFGFTVKQVFEDAGPPPA